MKAVDSAKLRAFLAKNPLGTFSVCPHVFTAVITFINPPLLTSFFTSTHLSFCLSSHHYISFSSVFTSVFPSLHLSFCLSSHLHICLSVCLHVCHHVFTFVFPSVSTSLHLSYVFLSVLTFLHLSSVCLHVLTSVFPSFFTSDFMS